MKMVSRTDIGKVRQVNEDRAAIHHQLNGLSLAIVADGMGGIKLAILPVKWPLT